MYRAGIGKRKALSPWNSSNLLRELRINCFEVIGKFEYETKLGCYLQPMVSQYIETQIEATMDRASVPLQLRRDCHEASS